MRNGRNNRQQEARKTLKTLIRLIRESASDDIQNAKLLASSVEDYIESNGDHKVVLRAFQNMPLIHISFDDMEGMAQAIIDEIEYENEITLDENEIGMVHQFLLSIQGYLNPHSVN